MNIRFRQVPRLQSPMARPDFPRTIMEFQERFPMRRHASSTSRPRVGQRATSAGRLRRAGLGARPPAPLAVLSLPSPGLGHRRNGDAPDPHPVSHLVWAAYLVATHHPRDLGQAASAPARLSRYETAWLILQKLRRAMVAPEREPLRDEVEVDEGFVGGVDARRRAGRDRVGKRLVGVAVEVRGAGSGRLRLATLPDASKRSPRSVGERQRRVRSDRPHRRLGRLRGGYPRLALTTGRSPSAGGTRTAR